MAISKAYSLSFPDKPKGASSDFIIPAFICNLAKARIQNPFSIQKYLEEFMIVFSQIDQDAQQRVFWVTCNQYILDIPEEEVKTKTGN